jgi:hypothetical protein
VRYGTYFFHHNALENDLFFLVLPEPERGAPFYGRRAVLTKKVEIHDYGSGAGKEGKA